MLTCIACSKQLNNGSLPLHPDQDDAVSTQSKKQPIKTLTTQIKGIALRATAAYKSCKPCSGGNADDNNNNRGGGSDGLQSMSSGRFSNRGYQRANPVIWGKERVIDPRVVVGVGLGLGLSSGESTPVSVSGRTDSALFMEDEDEPKEWVAQVEPGVLITFESLPQGGNELKRIRFGRELFNKWQAQRWWAENNDKVMELYNVQKFNQNAVPLKAPLGSEDETSKIGSIEGSPATPLIKESLPRNIHASTQGLAYSSSDSPDHNGTRQYHESCGLASTPRLSNISASKTEMSSIDASARSSSLSRVDHSGELSVSNASDMESEWVEQDEAGVYITIRALPNGTRELRRVRFSRERFGEMHARLWWEENKVRIQEQYL